MTFESGRRIKLFPVLAFITFGVEVAWFLLWKHTSNPQGFTTGALWGCFGSAVLILVVFFFEVLSRVAGCITVLTLTAWSWPQRLLFGLAALLAGPYFLVGFWIFSLNSDLSP